MSYFLFAFGSTALGVFLRWIVSVPSTEGKALPSFTGQTNRTLQQRFFDSEFGLLIAIAVTV